MLSKKTTMLMVIGLFVHAMHASENNPVIEAVKQLEKNIAACKKEERTLFYQCYEDKKVHDGSVSEVINGKMITKNLYRYELARKASCTDELVNRHNESRDKMNTSIGLSVWQIAQIAARESKDLLGAPDKDGYTALNYCYTPEIYNELRSQGAPFQFLPWAYFNPVSATSAAVGSVVTAATVYNVVRKK